MALTMKIRTADKMRWRWRAAVFAAFCAAAAAGTAGASDHAGTHISVIDGRSPSEPAAAGNWANDPYSEEAARARVTIGGWAWVAAYAGRYDGGMPLTESYRDPATGRERADLAGLWNGRNQKNHVTDFSVNSAMLTFDVAAGERMSLHIRLRLDDAYDRDYEPDDFLYAMYFEMRELWGMPIEARIGKQALPFGVRRDDLLLSPYIADRGDSGFSGRFNNPACDMDAYHPGAADRVFAAVVEWRPMALRDLLTLEAGVFQDRDGRAVDDQLRRSRDDLLFRSFAARLRFSPFEKMELSTGILSRYRDAADGGRRNWVWSVGLSSPLFVAPVTAFVEYQRSWRDDFVSGQHAEDVHAGLVWSLSPVLRLHARYEWLRVKRNGSATATGRGELSRFHRSLLAAEYELSSLITLEAGWQREWYKRRGHYYSPDPSLGGANLAHFSAGGDVFYMGMKYNF